MSKKTSENGGRYGGTAPDDSSMEEVFADIFARNGWGSNETVSGPGSTIEQTSMISNRLTELFRDMKFSSVLDAPCGDCHWIARICSENIAYTGVDIVEALISENRIRYSHQNMHFVCDDLTSMSIKRADLILCRDYLVHLPLSLAQQAIRNFQKSGSDYLLTTTFRNTDVNGDIQLGDWRPLNLERDPFSFPPPLIEIDESCSLNGGRYADKALGLWRIADLPILNG